jgi:hypothetical protein
MRSDLLTSSRLKDARACARLHFFKYIQGYRAVETQEALRFGTLVHLALEAWWKAAPEERFEEAMGALLDTVTPETDLFELARARVMMAGYHARWAEDAKRYEVLGVELPFVSALRNPQSGQPSRTWKLAGKLDGVVREIATGDVYVLEHKTSSEDLSAGGEYWKRLRLDGQVSVYYEGAKSLGHEVRGCLYDVLAKPKQKPFKATPEEQRKYTKATKTEQPRLYAGQRLTDETPEEYRVRLEEAVLSDEGLNNYFSRGAVVRLETEMNDAMFDVWQIGQAIREGELQDRHPRNPDACTRWGKTCSFFGVCTGEASLDDTAKFKLVPSVHPELSDLPLASPGELEVVQ